MARGSASSVLTALGLPAAVERTYQRVLPQSGRELTAVAAAAGRTPEELVADLGPLLEEGIVRIAFARIFVESPEEALARLIGEQGVQAAHFHARLQALAAAVPFLTAAQAGSEGVRDTHPIQGEVSSGGDTVAVIASLISRSRGDLVWLRPDQWRRPQQAAMTRVLRDAIESGRGWRAIYPVKALHEAPRLLRARAEIGEEIRLLPEVPTRLLVIGTTHAMLPEPLGFADEPRVVVRQPSVVQALLLLFEMMWERATPVPELEHGEARPDLRRFLLQQLATGAQDEQVARTLGISLRTVRRRVASIMSELGADSRFQAGVEAVRRGWL